MKRKWRFNRKERKKINAENTRKKRRSRRRRRERDRSLPHSTFKIQKILTKRSFFLNVMNIQIFLNLTLFNHQFLNRIIPPRRDRLNRTSSNGANPQPSGSSGISRDSSATSISSPLGQFLLRKSSTGGFVKAATAELEIGTGGGGRRGRGGRIGGLLKALKS